MIKSLKIKIIFIVIVIITLIFSLYIAFNIVNQYQILKIEQKIFLDSISSRLARSLWISVFENNVEQINNYLNTEMMNKNIYAIIVKDSIDNSIISGKIRDKNWEIIDYKESDKLNNHINKKVFITSAAENIGTIEVYITDKFSRKIFLKNGIIRLLLIIVLIGVIIVTLFISISKVIINPLKELKESVEIIMKGDLKKTINIKGNDEIGTLAKSFNLMRESLTEKINILDKKNKELNREIKEKENTKETLKKSEEKFKALYFNMIEGVALHETIYNKKGKPINYKIIDINPKYEEILNLKREDIINRLATEVYNTKEPPYLKEFTDVGEIGIPNYFETFFSPMNKHFAISVAQISKGQWATIFFDITARKQAEKALRESEERYKQLFEVSPEAITTSDLNTTITNCNNVTVALHGYSSKQEIIGKNAFDLIAPKDHEKARKEFSQMLDGNYVQNVELSFLRKNGEEFIGELSANIIKNINGEPIALIGISKDITDRKKFEKERIKQEQILMQVQKLNALGELAAGIAHEINQPLSGILMSADIIKIKLKSDKIDKEHIKEKINNITEYINRIKKIIEHIRMFSRDQKYAKIEEFDINESIRNALSLIEVQYKNHNINIKLELSPDLPKVKGNVYQFEQIVLNLISNSKDALDDKERIMNIKKFNKEIRLKTVYNDKNIIFEIYDNGIGIIKENIKDVFNPFFTTKETDKGTGLGLSISYGIIKEMKGNINIESEHMKYTKVKINFPEEYI